SLAVDRDAITFQPAKDGVGAIRLRSTTRPLSILSLAAVDASGHVNRLAFAGTLAAGQSSAWIAIAPIQLRQLRITYKPEPLNGGEVPIEIFAAATVPGGTKAVTRGPTVATVPAYVQVPVFFGTDRKRAADRVKAGTKLAVFSGDVGTELQL